MSHATIIHAPRYDAHGRLVGHEVTTYSPKPAHAQPPVTAQAIAELLAARLAAWDRRVNAKLEVAFQQCAAHEEEAERMHLAAQLAVHGWTLQECAGMPLVALKKLLRHLTHRHEEDLPPDAPQW